MLRSFIEAFTGKHIFKWLIGVIYGKEGELVDISQLLHVTISLTVGFLALIFSTHIVGKLQMSQATPFHFISAIVLGELLGNAVYDKEISVLFIIYTVAVWTMLIYLIEIITQKFRRTRGFFEGTPSIIVREGNIDFEQLKKNKMDLNELQRLLREKDVFSIREVQYAILEPGGSLSVLRKWKYDPVNRGDLDIPHQPVHLSIAMIMDGEILKENLKNANLTETWLMEQLEDQGIKNVKDIIYADWLPNEGMHIITFSQSKNKGQK